MVCSAKRSRLAGDSETDGQLGCSASQAEYRTIAEVTDQGLQAFHVGEAALPTAPWHTAAITWQVRQTLSQHSHDTESRFCREFETPCKGSRLVIAILCFSTLRSLMHPPTTVSFNSMPHLSRGSQVRIAPDVRTLLDILQGSDVETTVFDLGAPLPSGCSAIMKSLKGDKSHGVSLTSKASVDYLASQIDCHRCGKAWLIEPSAM